jgi:hypothetical protein
VTYLEIVRWVDLAQMTRGPVGGVAPTFPAYERRCAAITPEGRYAFVSRGGDGKVDTSTGAITGPATAARATLVDLFMSGMHNSPRLGRRRRRARSWSICSCGS